MTKWRGWALLLGTLVGGCGLILADAGGSPVVLIFGLLVIVTAALEPVYGRANGRPSGNHWRATEERFVDPESGKLVTVWFDPKTGERRYVDEAQARPPAA